MSVHTEKVVRKLQTPLTEQELHKASRELALCSQRTGSLDEEKKATLADFNARIKSQKAEIDRLCNIVANESELREVVCNEVFDFDQDEYRLVRTDSDHVVTVRPLMEEERQMYLPKDTEGEVDDEA